MDVLSYALSKKYTNEQINEQKLKVAKLEQELNNYKSVMSQVNINQEATQKASGYGIINLPKNAANGQVSGIEINGNTVSNVFYLKEENVVNFTVSEVVVDEEEQSITLTGTGEYRRLEVRNIKVKPNTKYYIKFYSEIISGEDNPLVRVDNKSIGTLVALRDVGLVEAEFNSGDATEVYLNIYATTATDSTQTKKISKIIISEVNHPYVTGTKSTVSAMRLKSVSADETETSTAYVVAKDEEGNIIELHSLPNGVADRIYQGTNGKWYLEKNIGISKDFSECKWGKLQEGHTDNFYAVYCTFTELNVDLAGKHLLEVSHKILNYTGNGGPNSEFSPIDDYFYRDNVLSTLPIKVPKSAYSGEWTLEETQEWFRQNDVKLIYQLAEPIVTPINVSGNLISYPSGTVYVENVVADAGIYTDKMSVLHQDLPIKALEKISKVDFNTGLETELDITAAVIAEDKLSFTHPDLTSGDIVFFVYEHGAEGTIPETEISYYDSRYVIKDSVTGKFYKWHIAVADGVPSIELTEV